MVRTPAMSSDEVSPLNAARMRGDNPLWAVDWWTTFERGSGDLGRDGYVYFIQQGRRGPIKIGYTSRDDVQRRIANLQTSSPYELRLLCVLRGGRMYESQLHEMFKYWRLRGEWFRPSTFGLRELIDHLSQRLPV